MICSIVQIILSIICLIYNAINQENIIIWVLFLCSGILLLSSNISKNNKKKTSEEVQIPVDISHILGNLITVIFDYQILRKPLKILSL